MIHTLNHSKRTDSKPPAGQSTVVGGTERTRFLPPVNGWGSALYHVMYAAWDHGVASCPMEGFDDALVETFDIPDGYEPVMIVALGYPADGAPDVENDRKGRRPVDEVVHYDPFDPSGEATLEAPSVPEAE